MARLAFAHYAVGEDEYYDETQGEHDEEASIRRWISDMEKRE